MVDQKPRDDQSLRFMAGTRPVFVFGAGFLLGVVAGFFLSFVV